MTTTHDNNETNATTLEPTTDENETSMLTTMGSDSTATQQLTESETTQQPEDSTTQPGTSTAQEDDTNTKEASDLNTPTHFPTGQ